MSVVELEPAVEELTEAEIRARVLEAAALEIDVRGWCRGDVVGSEGRVCLVGAIAAAAGADLSPQTDFPNRLYNIAGGCWSLAERHLIDGGWLFMFNDARALDAADVTFLLRWRAEEIRDGWL